ncbi:MAG: Fe-S cluster assembly ATPase SufC [Patescibacteria group bacterium]
MNTPILSLKHVDVSRDGTTLLHDISLDLQKGQIHMIMGPNGSGKSTLLNSIMGNPSCILEKGSIMLNGKRIQKLAPYERARLGLSMTFQNPVELPGVPFAHVVQATREGVSSRFEPSEQHLSPTRLAEKMKEVMKRVGMDAQFLYRSLNEGFSGGEKKKSELVQLALCKPAIALIDEIDSGLDIDALKEACALLCDLNKAGTALVIVTHNPRLIEYIQPNIISILVGGGIVRSGGVSLVEELEKKGYEAFSKS